VVSGLALWLWSTPLVWPFRLFATLAHELGHAAAAVLTGGQVLGIAVAPDGNGVTYTRGGHPVLVAAAGYLATTSVGAALLLWARAGGARTVLAALAAALLLAALLWVRDGFALVAALALAVAFGAVAQWGPRWATTLLVYLLAVLTGLHALHDLLTLVSITQARPWAHNDARLLQQVTGVPALLWALLWTGISLLLQGWALRHALQGLRARRRAGY
jgi:hypothetical protein